MIKITIRTVKIYVHILIQVVIADDGSKYLYLKNKCILSTWTILSRNREIFLFKLKIAQTVDMVNLH